MDDTIERSQVHATFVIERSYPVPVEMVWHALSDNDAREHWFGAGTAFDVHDKSHEFRVGGHGTEEGQWHGGPRSRFHSTYTDIVDLQRIVFTYDMWVDGRHLSTSTAWTPSKAGKRAPGDCSTSSAPISPQASRSQNSRHQRKAELHNDRDRPNVRLR